MEYSKDELLTILLAREIRNEDALLVGVGTPLAAAACFLAKATNAPEVTLMVGGAINPAVHDLSTTFRNLERLSRISQGMITHNTVLDQIQRGRFSMQFISPAQIDQWGNINNSVIGDYNCPKVRLPGPLALPDIIGMLDRIVIYVPNHDLRILTAKVDFITGAGHPEGGEWRKRTENGHREHVRLISDLGVFDFAGEEKRMTLRSIHLGVSQSTIQERTGFEVIIPECVPQTAEPTREELSILREKVDPTGLRKMELREFRQEIIQKIFLS